MIDKLKQLIEESGTILITSHLGPDADSLCSSLLLYQTLKANYLDKNIHVAMEEEAAGLNFVDGYRDIKFGPLVDVLNNSNPQLLVVLDANTYARISREAQAVKDYIDEKGVKTAIIDHHEPIGKDGSDVYINQHSPAVAQDVYEIFFEQLGLKKPGGYAQTALLGIYSDTGGFVYKNPRHKKTFEVVSQLIEDGADIEKIVGQLNKCSDEALMVLNELITNLDHSKDCTFSYVSDEFADNWLKSGKAVEPIKEGLELFTQHYLRNIEGRPWGFLVYRDLLAKERTYSVSFRSISGAVDVAAIAVKLGGGGHKPAAGAKLEAASVQEALGKAKEAADL